VLDVCVRHVGRVPPSPCDGLKQHREKSDMTTFSASLKVGFLVIVDKDMHEMTENLEIHCPALRKHRNARDPGMEVYVVSRRSVRNLQVNQSGSRQKPRGQDLGRNPRPIAKSVAGD